MSKSGLSSTLLLASLACAAALSAGDGDTRSVALSDVNRDGYLDLVDQRPGVRRTYLNDGFGRFTLAHSAAGVAGPVATAPFGDVDRDGDVDFVAVESGRAVLALSGGPSGELLSSAEPDAADTAVAMGDVDNDGDLDIAVFRSGAPDRLHLNRDAWGTCGSNVAACFDSIELPRESGSGSQAGAIGDVDADGLLDVVIVGETHGGVYFGQPNGRDANPFTAPAIAFGSDTLSVVSLGGPSKGTVTVASYSPPPGHASCDPAVPTGADAVVNSRSAKSSAVAKVGDDQQVRDHGEPVQINLIGPACLTVEQGIAFVDPGANAWTPVFGDLTDWITVSDTVNTAVVGTYTVTYSVIDPDEYRATAWRTVFVQAPPGAAPPPASDGGGGGGSCGLELWSLLAIALARRRWKGVSVQPRSGLPRA